MSQPTRSLTSAAVLLAALSYAAVASAQTALPVQASTPPPTESTRPATTTFFGDTGIWFVPTAETLPTGKWSVSFYRRGTDYLQGHTNVGDFAATFGVGIKRAEFFGSFLMATRIDRDAEPTFFNDAAQGGIVDRYPRTNELWTAKIGDLYVGTKINLMSESEHKPVAFAVRGMVKLPTGNFDAGTSTGKADVMFDAILSKEIAERVEVSGYAGYDFRGSPDGFDIPTRAFRWGMGATLPSRFNLRAFAELNGVRPNINTATITTASLVGLDLSRPPLVSTTEAQTRATLGLTYQARGFFAGTGLSLSLPRNSDVAVFGSTGHANWDWQVRLGYHPGVRKYVAPVPPPPMVVEQAPPPPPAPRHTLSVKASCETCTVEVSKTTSVTATVTDSINCPVTYAWTAPSGSFTTATARVTPWTAPAQVGRVAATVTVTCPTDGMTATDTITLDVTRAVVKTYAFDDVYFDFDRAGLRPDALRVLDTAVDAMKSDATLSLTIEGNTCNIGTAEYNLALGERRANVVRDYLISRGIGVDRLRSVSYGEERPKFDNAREETRRLNRRAVLVVTLLR